MSRSRRLFTFIFWNISVTTCSSKKQRVSILSERRKVEEYFTYHVAALHWEVETSENRHRSLPFRFEFDYVCDKLAYLGKSTLLVSISISLRLREWQICIFWPLTIVLYTLRISTTKSYGKRFKIPFTSLIRQCKRQIVHWQPISLKQIPSILKRKRLSIQSSTRLMRLDEFQERRDHNSFFAFHSFLMEVHRIASKYRARSLPT